MGKSKVKKNGVTDLEPMSKITELCEYVGPYPLRQSRIPEADKIHDRIELIIPASDFLTSAKGISHFKFTSFPDAPSSSNSTDSYLTYEFLRYALKKPQYGSDLVIRKGDAGADNVDEPEEETTTEAAAAAKDALQQQETPNDVEREQDNIVTEKSMWFTPEFSQSDEFPAPKPKFKAYLECLVKKGPDTEEEKHSENFTLSDLLSDDNFAGIRFVIISLDKKFKFNGCLKRQVNEYSKIVEQLHAGNFRKKPLRLQTYKKKFYQENGYRCVRTHFPNIHSLRDHLRFSYGGNKMRMRDDEDEYTGDGLGTFMYCNDLCDAFTDDRVRKYRLSMCTDLWDKQNRSVFVNGRPQFFCPELVWEMNPELFFEFPKFEWPWIPERMSSLDDIRTIRTISMAGHHDQKTFAERLRNSKDGKLSAAMIDGRYEPPYVHTLNRVKKQMEELYRKCNDPELANDPDIKSDYLSLKKYIHLNFIKEMDSKGNSEQFLALVRFINEIINDPDKRTMCDDIPIQDTSLSVFGNMLTNLMAQYETTACVANSHMYLFLIFCFTCSSFSELDDLKLNFRLVGKAGDSKSFLLYLLFLFCVRGTVQYLSGSSALGEFEDSGTDLRNLTTIKDELDIFFTLVNNNLNASQQRALAMWKELLSSNCLKFKRNVKGEDDNIHSKLIEIVRHGIIGGGTNVETAADSAMEDRFYTLNTTVWKTNGRDIFAKMLSKELVDKLEDTEMQERHQKLHCLVSMAQCMMKAGDLNYPDTELFATVLQKMKKSLKQQHIDVIRSRDPKRLRLTYIIMIIIRAVHVVFFSEFSPFRKNVKQRDGSWKVEFEPFKMDQMLELNKHFSGCSEIAIFVISFYAYSKLPVKHPKLIHAVSETMGKFDVSQIRKELIRNDNNVQTFFTSRREVNMPDGTKRVMLDPVASVFDRMKPSDFCWKYYSSERTKPDMSEMKFDYYPVGMVDGKPHWYDENKRQYTGYSHNSSVDVMDRNFKIREGRDDFRFIQPFVGTDAPICREVTMSHGGIDTKLYDFNYLSISGNHINEISQNVVSNLAEGNNIQAGHIAETLEQLLKADPIYCPSIPLQNQPPRNHADFAQFLQMERLKSYKKETMKCVIIQKNKHGRMCGIYLNIHLLFMDPLQLIENAVDDLCFHSTPRKKVLLGIPMEEFPMILHTFTMEPKRNVSITVANPRFVPETLMKMTHRSSRENSSLRFGKKRTREEQRCYITIQDESLEDFFGKRYYERNFVTKGYVPGQVDREIYGKYEAFRGNEDCGIFTQMESSLHHDYPVTVLNEMRRAKANIEETQGFINVQDMDFPDEEEEEEEEENEEVDDEDLISVKRRRVEESDDEEEEVEGGNSAQILMDILDGNLA